MAILDDLKDVKMEGFREAINRNPLVILGGVGLVLFFILALMFARSRSAGPRPVKIPPIYYSDDDGASVFTDTAYNVPPFDHHGRETVRAYCVTGSDGKQVVTCLEKWTDLGKNILLGGDTTTIPAKEHLFKRPGDPTWVAANDPAARSIAPYPLP